MNGNRLSPMTSKIDDNFKQSKASGAIGSANGYTVACKGPREAKEQNRQGTLKAVEVHSLLGGRGRGELETRIRTYIIRVVVFLHNINKIFFLCVLGKYMCAVLDIYDG